MKFGHYTVFDTPAENKHTQVYVEYDVPNNNDLDGATGTMILSDGHSETSGGGDSRFSTCEVEVNFTLNGQPLTLTEGSMAMVNGYTPSPVTLGEEISIILYTATAYVHPDNNIVTPLLFEGSAYMLIDFTGFVGDTYYVTNTNVPPVLTGDISIGTYGNTPVLVVRGNGTITIEMMED